MAKARAEAERAAPAGKKPTPKEVAAGAVELERELRGNPTDQKFLSRAKSVAAKPAPAGGGVGKAILKGAAETGKTSAKVVAPMVVLGLAQHLGQKNYDEAATLRDTYVGPPTEDQLARQRAAGYTFTGEFDENGRPKWRYDPPLPMHLRNMILYLIDPFSPIRPSGRPSTYDKET